MESDQAVGFMLKVKHFFVVILHIEIFCVNSHVLLLMNMHGYMVISAHRLDEE